MTQVPGGGRPSHGEPGDRELVARLARGEQAALGEVYDRYGRACYSLARCILGGDAPAEDVVRDVFLALWREVGRFDQRRGTFATYLMAMTHHQAVDAVRKQDNERRRQAPVDVLEGRGDVAIDVVAEVWREVRGRYVRSALAELPVEQREPLLLAYYGGYTQGEIAALTGTPLGTVKTRVLSGMRRLRRELEIPLADGESRPASRRRGVRPTPGDESAWVEAGSLDGTPAPRPAQPSEWPGPHQPPRRPRFARPSDGGGGNPQ
ncbi:MAG: sigma-70 family RNA polymerase sigma factor [Frankia sp.]